MAKEYKWVFTNRKMPPSDTLLWLYKSYVLNCPVPGVSNCSKTFADLGLTGRKLTEFQRKLKKESTLTTATWQSLTFPVDWKEPEKKNRHKNRRKIDLPTLLEDNNLINGYKLENEFAYYYNAKDSKTAGLFYLIRNALAHGSFCYHNVAGNEWVVFETKRQQKLRGRAVVKLATLKRWILLLHEFRSE